MEQRDWGGMVNLEARAKYALKKDLQRYAPQVFLSYGRKRLQRYLLISTMAASITASLLVSALLMYLSISGGMPFS